MSIASTSSSDSTRIAICLLATGVCAALHVWKLAPALPVLQVELGMSLVQAGFLLSMVQFAGMTLGLMIGLMAERMGRRRCIAAGLALLAGVSLLSTVFSSGTMMLLFRALEGCGFLMAVLPVPSMFRQRLPPSTLSRVMGLWGAYIPTGTILILIFGAWLISLGGWRVLWWVLAVLTLAMMATVLVMVPDDAPGSTRKDAETGCGSGAAAHTPSAWHLIRQTLGSVRVWLVALIFGCYAAQWMAVIGFLPTIYAAENLSVAMAGGLTGLVAGANIIGNLAAGQLLHRGVPVLRLQLAGFVVMMLATLFAFAVPASLPARFTAVLLFSTVGGLIPASCFILALRVAPSPQTTTTTVGWMQQGSALGQFLGPPVMAMVVNVAGGWQWAWLTTAVLGTTGMALACALHRQASS